jgi:hypothetical protein
MTRTWLTAAFGIAIVVVVVVLTLPRNHSEEPVPADAPPPAPSEPAASAAAKPSAETAPTRPETPPVVTPPAGRGATPPAAAAAPPEAAAAETGAVLQVRSDVPGASVFLDRQYVGVTPLTLKGVELGQKRLNVSAQGHDSYADTITVKDGTNTVNVEFKRVRLNESVAVVHKHTMGSCQGTLLATAAGLRYNTTNENDAFTLPFGEVEEFDVDYQKKNLRVKRRGGKTWNFTTAAATADPLFVFHRDVEKARQKIAAK